MADGYLQGQLSAAQDAVMARALDFMTTRSAELHALDAAHEHLLELQEGMEQQLFFHLVGADNANNGIMAPHGLAPHPHGGDGDALLLAGELLGDDKEESDDEEEGEEFGEDEGGMEGLQNNGEMIDVVMEGGGGGGGEAVELLLQDMFGGEDAAPAA
ncbi:hypothetical protein HXX76_000823 [Chlamydomonas incerta]|uniref:Uncharacterized protein n=1 Tax=Chlamydomonas incerta TaxID=51695 RepID=A0A835WF33_CHLIN|nr:hypothetical protein HXX76_000823 [Chlamydomonas incerta]|eukprot:KAG2446231.1 hypothetical protein HXX76_000823 [Chlamydomonas incerta]